MPCSYARCSSIDLLVRLAIATLRSLVPGSTGLESQRLLLVSTADPTLRTLVRKFRQPDEGAAISPAGIVRPVFPIYAK